MLILKRNIKVGLNLYKFSSSTPPPPQTPPQSEPNSKPQQKIKGSFVADMKKFFHITKPEYKRYISNCFLTIVSSAIYMYLPNIFTDIQYMLSLNVNTVPANQILTSYATLTAKWLGIFGISTLIGYQRRFYFMDVSNRIGARLRYVFYKNLLKSDLYKNKDHSQTYTYKMITAIKAISQFMGQNTFMFIRGVSFVIGGLACFFYTQPSLALMSIIGVTGYSLFVRKYQFRVKSLKQLEIKALNSLSQSFSQRISNAKLIKLSNAKSYQHIQFLKQLKNLYTKSTNVAKTSGLTIGLMQGLGLTFLFLVSTGGAALISFNLASFSLMKSSTYAIYVGMGVRSITSFFIQYAKISAQIKNLESTFKDLYKDPQYQGVYPLQIIDQKLQQLKKLQQQNLNQFKLPQKFNIQLKDVQFNYPGSTSYSPTINWTMNSGKFIAFVGPSGVGKSTLLHVLTTLYLPHKGNIYINGQILPDNQLFLQQNISYITQDNMVFSQTFRYNLCYGNQNFDISDQKLIECLKLSQSYNFVMAKGGLDAIIKQNASDLSGGQKQKIVIARALVKQPKILIMDQATSNVDYISEQKIFSNLKKALPNSLVIIVNHKIDLISQYIDETVNFLDITK